MRRISALFIIILAAVAASCSESAAVHLQRADQYFEQKKYPEAVLEYRIVVQADPQSGTARKKLGQAYLQAGDVQGAFDELVRAADLLPDDIDVQVIVARFLQAAGHFEDLKTRATRIVEKDPQNVDGHILLGAALLGLKDPDGAVEQIQNAINLDPTQSRAYDALAAFKVSQSDLKEAEAAFRKAIEIDPKSVSARLALATFLWSARRPADCETELKYALGLDPKSAQTNKMLAVFCLARGRTPEAERYLKAAAQVEAPAWLALTDYYVATGREGEARDILVKLVGDPRIGDLARIQLAEILLKDGKTADASRAIDEILRRGSHNAAANLLKARLCLADNRLDDALTNVTQALDAEPDNVLAHYLLADIQLAKLRPTEAAKEFRQVLRINPLAVPAQMQLARIAARAGDWPAAIDAAFSALALQPRNVDAELLVVQAMIAGHDSRTLKELDTLLKAHPELSAAHTFKAIYAGQQGDPSSARRSYEQALSLDASNLVALSGLVALDAQSKRLPEARHLIDARLAKTPNDPDVLILAARADISEGQPEAAERRLTAAIDVNPSFLAAYNLLGNIYLVEHRLPEAVAEFGAAAQRHPDSIAAPTMVAMILTEQNKKDQAVKQYERVMDVDPNAAVAANNLAWLYMERGEHLDVALQLAR